jgi:hypothetical protein
MTETYLLFIGCQTIMESALGAAMGAALTVAGFMEALTDIGRRETTDWDTADFMETDISYLKLRVCLNKKQMCKVIMTKILYIYPVGMPIIPMASQNHMEGSIMDSYYDEQP